MQLFLHITYIEMCTFVCRLVNPFNCYKLNGQSVNLYIVYISNKDATQYFSLILEATLLLSLIFGSLFY